MLIQVFTSQKYILELDANIKSIFEILKQKSGFVTETFL